MKELLNLQPIAAFAFAVGFIGVYSAYGKWWKTSIGRHMIGFMAGCVVVLSLAILVRLFPELRDNLQLRFWAWNLVIALFAWRFWVAVQVWILKNQSDLQRLRDEEDVDIKRVRRHEDAVLRESREQEDS